MYVLIYTVTYGIRTRKKKTEDFDWYGNSSPGSGVVCVWATIELPKPSWRWGFWQQQKKEEGWRSFYVVVHAESVLSIV